MIINHTLRGGVELITVLSTLYHTVPVGTVLNTSKYCTVHCTGIRIGIPISLLLPTTYYTGYSIPQLGIYMIDYYKCQVLYSLKL